MKENRIVKLLIFLFSILGFFFSLILLLIFFYGDTSNERRRVIFNSINLYLGVDQKYDSYIANTPKKLAIRYFNYFKNQFVSFPFDNLNIEIDLENLKKLEKLRVERLNQISSDKLNNAVSNNLSYVDADINLFNKKKELNKKIKVKIKPKGDRSMHLLSLDDMSYKIDLKGKDNYIYGMEEMSIQKPIVRNYAWEILYQDVLKDNNLIGLDLIPIKLYRNNQYLGIFVIEQGFNKELLEKQYRKEGPIIGIDEDFSDIFPSVKYKYYSEDYWKKQERLNIYNKSFNNLETIRTSYKDENFILENYFDLKKWAEFFAISDLLMMFHGTIPKSVKLYFNPTNGLFEPIGFDGHHMSSFEDFSFIDFIIDPNSKCSYICDNKDWYLLFFSKKNKEFLKHYISFINFFINSYYASMLENIYEKKIKNINNFFYTELRSSDRVFFGGVLPYLFDIQALDRRFLKIKNKVLQLEKYLEDYYLSSVNRIKNDEFTPIDFNLNEENIFVPKGVWTLENISLIDKKITLDEGAIIILRGKNSFRGVNNEFLFVGNGMIVQESGSLNLENVRFLKLKNIEVKGYNWSGAINVLNSTANFKNILILDSSGEDAINLVNSNSRIENLEITNSQSDGVDIDFGILNFNNITCKNIGNDCLDISGANVNGIELIGEDIKDKLGSFGESSKVFIEAIQGKDISIGVVSKDSTNVIIENLDLKNFNILAAAYTKKFFFNSSNLEIKNLINKDENQKKIFVSKNNKILINGKEYKNFTKNEKIISLIY